METDDSKQLDSIPDHFETVYQKREANLARNKKLLAEFSDNLDSVGLTEHIVDKRVDDMDTFLNDYLLGGDCKDLSYTMEDGVHMVEDFLGDWLIRYRYISETPLRSYTISLKKFYKLQCGKGRVSVEDYNNVCKTIKNGIDHWVDASRKYRNSDKSDLG